MAQKCHVKEPFQKKEERSIMFVGIEHRLRGQRADRNETHVRRKVGKLQRRLHAEPKMWRMNILLQEE